MPNFPPDHPDRLSLAGEVHARPPEPVTTPARASYVAVLVDADDRARELDHLAALCACHGLEPPAAKATHFRAEFDGLRLKWERHGEFSGYLAIVDGASAQPFDEPAASRLPAGWLAALPGPTIAAVHVEFLAGDGGIPDAAVLAAAFDGHPTAGSTIADGAASAHTAFRLHGDGCARFLVVDHGLTRGQAGRTLQRLTEIEAYRMLALLALPIARRQTPRLLRAERELSTLTDGIARGGGDDERLLHELTRLAAEIESGVVASEFRYGACKAYDELVMRRIAELREQRLPGVQTIEEFLTRRHAPAVATCLTAAQRLAALSERVARASHLLSTRVDIARERQNQALLTQMNRRARLQLRLQQTVEGLSVAAIVYYLAGLVGYLAKGLKAGGLKLEPDLLVGGAIPLLALVALLVVRRARRHADEEAVPEP